MQLFHCQQEMSEERSPVNDLSVLSQLSNCLYGSGFDAAFGDRLSEECSRSQASHSSI
ncbi:MAG: hypothetical protein F6K00_24780 [Leptolyngbya sp. SIOISBB]|nr:hypothetical protein [Leptolyngbya sp. SIOISBB]